MKNYELQNYIYKNIPITKALGINVVDATLTKVVLTAPLAANINHKKTVFGGSLHAIATLACWSLVFVNLQQKNLFAEIVISQSNIQYIRPITSDFKAICILEDESSWDKFMKVLQKKGKSRIHLNASIYQDDQLAVQYSGKFVGILHKNI